MMKFFHVQPLVWCMGIVVFIMQPLAIAQDFLPLKRWNINQRLQIAYEYDDNVLESLQQPLQSPSLKLAYDAKGRAKLPYVTVQMGYHGGCQFYLQVEDENKLINELHTELTVRMSKRLQLGCQGWARLKLFLNRENDYAWTGWRAFAQTSMLGEVILKVGFSEELFDYARTDFYSYYSPGLFFQAHRRLAQHITLSPQLHYASMKYKRHAFDKGDDKYSYRSMPHHQEDEVLTSAWHLEGSWPTVILNLSYRYEMNTSNSYGYSYHRHVIMLSFIKQLGQFYLRGYGTVQKKHYHDNLLPFYPLQLDTEREESNFIILDVTHDLSSFVGGILRAAWYQNESPWANLYYDKRLLSMGVEFRF